MSSLDEGGEGKLGQKIVLTTTAGNRHGRNQRHRRAAGWNDAACQFRWRKIFDTNGRPGRLPRAVSTPAVGGLTEGARREADTIVPMRSTGHRGDHADH